MKKLLGIFFLLMYNQLQAQESFKQALREKTMKAIQEVVDSSVAMTGLMAIDLTSGEHFAINENSVFPTASTIKIPILIEVLRQAGLKKFAMSDLQPVKPGDVVAGSGIIQSFADPVSLTIRNLCILMISISDNTATNVLIDLVGMPNVNSTLRSLGFTQTKLQRKMINPAASGRGEENISTPAEAANILQAIYKGEIVDKSTSAEIMGVLNKCVRRSSRLAKGLPDNVPIAFKDGLLPGVSAEWAIISLPGRPYAVVMMENFKIENSPSQSMEKISEILYQYFWRLGNATRFGIYLDRSLIK